MDKLNFFKHLCQDTFDKCFVFMKDPKQSHQYQKVDHPGKEDDDEKEDFDNNEWGNQTSIYKTPTNEKPADLPLTTVKKSVLIGNYDDDMLVRKRDEVV